MTEPQATENTSGTGPYAAVPLGVPGWSWGAFCLSWIWGIFNNVYIALLVFIPIANIIMMFVLGVKGREWAWRNKRWQSVEHFNKVQKKWSIAGLILFPLIICFFIWFFMSFFAGPKEAALRALTTNEQALAFLGEPVSLNVSNVSRNNSCANGTYTAKGSQNSAKYIFSAAQRGEKWVILEATLFTANGIIDIVPLTNKSAYQAEMRDCLKNND
ncbi:hypothetical protein WJT86_00630 [Microvirga sp. W0021]|uniref:Cytochrome oxidase complex assembly protein 1 n=1 Tax=Hohaiivirga grylli TaxID=3133970 RepID=A0ABV0BGY8_9HYPH